MPTTSVQCAIGEVVRVSASNPCTAFDPWADERVLRHMEAFGSRIAVSFTSSSTKSRRASIASLHSLVPRLKKCESPRAGEMEMRQMWLTSAGGPANVRKVLPIRVQPQGAAALRALYAAEQTTDEVAGHHDNKRRTPCLVGKPCALRRVNARK